MNPRLTRRAAIAGTGGLLLGAIAPYDVRAVETMAGGRLGFAMMDHGSGHISGNRLDERFALCSTFKLPLAALVLQAINRGELKRDSTIPVRRSDLVPHAPVAGPAVGSSLSVLALAEAAQTTSDNVAANLLMRELGGPAGVTRRLRALGDEVTRIDRWEPEMNRVSKDDPRDTSTPRAMAHTVAKLVLSDALKPESSALLVKWMEQTRTGMRRLRASVPKGWRVGDKTGTGQGPGMPNRVNDLAVVWPPKAAPLVFAAFYEAPGSFPDTRPQDEQVLADAMMVTLGPISGI
jgi:beta-lactamase class A